MLNGGVSFARGSKGTPTKKNAGAALRPELTPVDTFACGMSLGTGGSSVIAYEADNDRALSMFATALKVASRRSTAVAQLLECANRALAVGETQLDSIRLDGLQATDEDVEVHTVDDVVDLTGQSQSLQELGGLRFIFVVMSEFVSIVDVGALCLLRLHDSKDVNCSTASAGRD